MQNHCVTHRTERTARTNASTIAGTRRRGIAGARSAALWLNLGLLVLALGWFGCASNPSGPVQVSRRSFGQSPDGKEVSLFSLRNSKGAEALICNYGGIVTSLKVPDRNGTLGDVVLGYDNLADYIKDSPYFGALIGRYGNRIARGKFTLDGKEYTLVTNNYPNALHGGRKGFDKVVWEPTVLTGPEGPGLKLTYLSKDGEEGYPGNLSVTVVYTLTEDNALKVEYTASTDKDTVVNLTQHSYFNLAGKDSILNHAVMIPADKFTPVDSTLIPTGELRPVEGTPFDFRTPTVIGARIKQDDEQLKFGGGYDHNWVINKPMGEMGLMARVTEPTTGRVMEVLSTEPGLQFYSGNFLDGTLKGKGGWVYQFRSAFAMEPQHFPDSPNKPEFPSVVLKPGQVYHNAIIYKFSTGS
jgi:aldose 1-epimerase